MRPSRIAILVFACSALLYAQGSGVHLHLALDHPHGPSHEVADVHEHGAAHVVNEHDSGHAAVHADEGTVDLDVTDKLLGKTFSLSMAAAIFAAIILLIAHRTSLTAPRPRNRRLPYRQRFHHLIPPPQAPPLAS